MAKKFIEAKNEHLLKCNIYLRKERKSWKIEFRSDEISRFLDNLKSSSILSIKCRQTKDINNSYNVFSEEALERGVKKRPKVITKGMWEHIF